MGGTEMKEKQVEFEYRYIKPNQNFNIDKELNKEAVCQI